MENRFLHEGTVLAVASMNKMEIFYRNRWCFLNELLSKNAFFHFSAEELADILFLLIQQLKTDHQQLRRNEWTEEHWQTWRELECLHFCGGSMKTVTAVQMIPLLKHRLKAAQIDVELIVSKYPGQASIVGAGKFLSLMGKEGLLFDFGHTGIKRGYVEAIGLNEYKIESLDWIESRHVGWDYQEIEEARKLHEYILNVILDTLNQHSIEGELDIFISIANYVVAGVLIQRGGYGKLALLSDNYQNYLGSELKRKTGKEVKVWLCHDTTAASFEAETLKKTAVISFGTGMGVSFVQQNIQSSILKNHYIISEKIT